MLAQSTKAYRRLQARTAVLMNKVKNNMCPTYFSILFEQPAIKYKLRNHDFTIPRFNIPLESTRSGIWAQRYKALFLVT